MDKQPMQPPQGSAPQNLLSQTTPQSIPSKKNKKGIIIASILLVVLLFSAGVYMLGTKKREPSSAPPPTQTAISPTISDITNKSDLLAGGSSYKDPENLFTVLYPSDYTLDTSDPKHPRIYKLGATQKGQTEMYDGVLVVFETIELQGKSLSEWADQHIKTATRDRNSELISQKKPFQLKTYPGFVYELRGLGIAKYYVVQKDATSNYAVVITTSVQDPQNIGFQEEVDEILSTIDLLK